ncbi:GNAT family N-acetyltransferase [Humitalea sp. 24SJ18S-53]|uniref:GNAT family N-acetyltransferase n=1 Tax=Humitalea sp. 24SJ18S-53 TaxID=3422307 RepID=UPI003D672EE4
MRCAADAARLVPLHDARLPDWCDRFLAPPGSGDFFAGRVWYDTVLAGAIPSGAQPVLAVGGAGDAVLLPLLRQAGRLRSLVTPYTLGWAPLLARRAEGAALRDAGRGLGHLLHGRGPTLLEAMDPQAQGLPALLDGLRATGLSVDRFRHFGNWRAPLRPGDGWDAYLAERPPALRATIRRKTARAGRFTAYAQSGPMLEAGIAAYCHVRARSWKPQEPFPAFDPALMRAAAATGGLRLGVLSQADGQAIAAQYWVVSGGRACLLKLAHDQGASAASPGTALTALMIRGLIDEDGVTELDFGRGDDAYKQLWAGQRTERCGVVLTDPWHPAGWVELGRQALAHGRRWLSDRMATGNMRA